MGVFRAKYKHGEEVWWRHPDGFDMELKIENSKVRWRRGDILPQRYYSGQLKKYGAYSIDNLGAFLMNVRESDLRKKVEEPIEKQRT